MSFTSYKELKSHIGHDIELVSYKGTDEICLECLTCSEVLKSWDKAYFKDKEKND